MRARLPFAVRRMPFGLVALGSPPLTPWLGPWIEGQDETDQRRRVDREMELMARLVDGLPRFDHFAQRFDWAVVNWLPFHWAGFSATTRYTYVLDDIADPERLWAAFPTRVRGAIRKAEGLLRIRDDLGVDELLRLVGLSFAHRGVEPGLSDAAVRRAVAAAQEHGAGRMLFAVDSASRTHAALFVVWDERASYNLLSGTDPELRQSGAQSLLLWEAIRSAGATSRCFDFEGSMLRGVEMFFRGFGGRQTPYFAVTRDNFRGRALVAGRSLVAAVGRPWH